VAYIFANWGGIRVYFGGIRKGSRIDLDVTLFVGIPVVTTN